MALINKSESEKLYNYLIREIRTCNTLTSSEKDIFINYLVDINSLNKLINKTDTDFSTKADSIKLYFDKEENLIRISYGLDNYCKKNNICNSNLEIGLEKK